MEPGHNGAVGSSGSRKRSGGLRLHGLLLAIIALGLALRLWGIGWSLPDARHPIATYHPDELVNLNAAVNADISHGKFDTGFYNYGAFYFYLVSFAQTFGRGYHLIPKTPLQQNGSLALSDTAVLVQEAPEQAALFLAGRLVTALLGAATTAVVYAVGKRSYSRRAGLFAAALYAVAPLAVVHAHFLTVDVPSTFFVSLALLWAVRLLDSVTWKEAALAGVWCGLAAATKYNTVLVIVAPLTALILAFTSGGGKTPKIADQRFATSDPTGMPVSNMPGPPSSQTAQRDPAQYLLYAAILAAVTIMVFLIACPGPWLDWKAFWNGLYPGSGVRYELFEHARLGHGTLFINTGPGWWYHLVVSLKYGLGIPLLLVSLAGVGFAAWQRKPADWLLLSFLMLFYLATGFSAVRFARYLIPLYPVFCVLAARLITLRFHRTLGIPSVAVAGALIVFYTAVYSCCLVRAMAQPDPRDVAAAYLEQSAPQGASIALARIPWFFSPPLSPLWGALRSDIRARAAEQTTRFEFRVPAVEWDASVLAPLPDYVILSNFETNNDVGRLKFERPTQFVNAVRNTFRPVVFLPAYVPGLSPATEPIPEDLLYILPVITVYQK